MDVAMSDMKRIIRKDRQQRAKQTLELQSKRVKPHHYGAGKFGAYRTLVPSDEKPSLSVTRTKRKITLPKMPWDD
jgi:hypothetical protein